MARIGLYKGFSMFEFQSRKSFKLRDIELVKMDLLNHIFTRKGERIMMPNFGTSIQDLLFEPMTSEVVDTAAEEVIRVIAYDPRVDLVSIQAVPDYDLGAITIAAQLFYKELNMTDNFELHLEFDV